jgi:ribosomal protein S18 acetylase RimI-like enzyme
MGKKSTELSEVTIRIADPVDAELLVDLGRSSFYEAFAEETAPRDMADHLRTAFKIEDIAEQLKNDQSLFVIIEIGPAAAGYAYLHPEAPPDCIKTPHPVKLSRFYLRKDYYGRNVGNTLMKACLDFARARGFQSVWLSTWEFNHRASAFYKKWEFEIAGRAKFTVGSDVQNDNIFLRSI